MYLYYNHISMFLGFLSRRMQPPEMIHFNRAFLAKIYPCCFCKVYYAVSGSMDTSLVL